MGQRVDNEIMRFSLVALAGILFSTQALAEDCPFSVTQIRIKKDRALTLPVDADELYFKDGKQSTEPPSAPYCQLSLRRVLKKPLPLSLTSVKKAGKTEFDGTGVVRLSGSCTPKRGKTHFILDFEVGETEKQRSDIHSGAQKEEIFHKVTCVVAIDKEAELGPATLTHAFEGVFDVVGENSVSDSKQASPQSATAE